MRGAGGASPFAPPPPLSGADVAARLASLRRLQSEGAELANSPLPSTQPAGELCTPPRLRAAVADSPAARAPPALPAAAPAPAPPFGAAAAAPSDDDEGDDGDAMSGFRRVAAAGFAEAPPSAQELREQKAAAQLAELRRLREAAAELLRRRDGDTSSGFLR